MDFLISMPRYLNPFRHHCKGLVRFLILLFCILNGMTSLFERCSLYPEAALYLWNHCRREGSELDGLDKKTRRSSVYRASLYSSAPYLIPLMVILERIAVASGSIAIKNNSGELGQPWRTPLDSRKAHMSLFMFFTYVGIKEVFVVRI